MTEGICRICGHKKGSHYEREPSGDLPIPDIGCLHCNREFRACPGFSSEMQ